MIEETWKRRVSKLNWSSMYEVGIYWTTIVWSMEEVRFGEGYSISVRRRYRDPPILSMFTIMKRKLCLVTFKTWNNASSSPSTVARKKFPPLQPPLLRPTIQLHINGQVELEKKIRVEKSKETTKLRRRPVGWAVNGPPFGGQELAPIKRPWKGWRRGRAQRES